MTKFLIAAALIVALSAGSVVSPTTAEAGPYNNPFAAVNGR